MFAIAGSETQATPSGKSATLCSLQEGRAPSLMARTKSSTLWQTALVAAVEALADLPPGTLKLSSASCTNSAPLEAQIKLCCGARQSRCRPVRLLDHGLKHVKMTLGKAAALGKPWTMTSALVVWRIWAKLLHKSVHGQCPWVVV